MIKRFIYVCLIIILPVNFSSCFHEWGEMEERTNPDLSLLLPPNYTENYTYLPIIEYQGKEYRVDQLRCSDSNEYYLEEHLIVNYSSLEKYFREMNNSSLIVYGTVIDNAVQKEIHSTDDSANKNEILCPFKISEIFYTSEGIDADVGEIIELSWVGAYYLCTDQNGEVVSRIRALGMPFISGAQYLLYLTYSDIQPDYDYKRYTVYSNTKFEVTDYSSSFDFNSDKAFEASYGSVALRKYDLHNVAKFTYDIEKYPPTASLGSADDVKTVGIKIGDIIVEGYEEILSDYKCIGYSEKNGTYSYEYYDYSGYDISSGIIPEGCPIIVSDFDDRIELILNGIPGAETNNRLYLYVNEVSLYDMMGKTVGLYGPDIMQFTTSDRAPIPYGIYWLKIEYTVPGPETTGEITPEVGKEYEGQKSYLFAIVMD